MAAVAGLREPDRHFNRAANAVKVWYNPQALAAGWSAFLPAPPERGPELAKALLAGTRRLVLLARAVWLDAVRKRHPETGFDPAKFFRSEAAAGDFSDRLKAAKWRELS
jgi:hypothetical protein